MTSIKNNLLIRRLQISFNFILYLSLLLKYFCAFPIQFCDVKILTLVTIMDIIWRVHKNNEELQAKLIPFLPLEYKYKVVEYNLLEDSQIPLERKFYAEFHVQGICSKEQFYSFHHAISDLTSTSWNKSHRNISFCLGQSLGHYIFCSCHLQCNVGDYLPIVLNCVCPVSGV